MPINEIGKGNRRFFAVVSLGMDRWYWVVWPSLEEVRKAEIPLSHIAEGYEKTKAGAVEKALDVAGRYAKWIAGKYAKAYHHQTKTRQARKEGRRPIDSSPHLPVLHEFLYRDVYNETTKLWTSLPHRVVRRTEKYVYVDQVSYSSDHWTESWLEGDRPTYRLDRQSLEQNGYAFIPPTAYLADHEEPLFFVSERGKWHGGQLPVCLEVLNLAWPCTVAEVHEAYRKLVKYAHPDGGGSHDKFLELQAAYEQALQLCR